MKSEPGAWSWDDQLKAGAAEWDGVRNYQASNNLKAMKRGDRAFFYHSVDERSIVGVVEIAREHYPDPTDPKGRFGMVDVTAKIPVKSPVTLADIKAEPAFTLSEFLSVARAKDNVAPEPSTPPAFMAREFLIHSTM